MVRSTSLPQGILHVSTRCPYPPVVRDFQDTLYLRSKYDFDVASFMGFRPCVAACQSQMEPQFPILIQGTVFQKNGVQFGHCNTFIYIGLPRGNRALESRNRRYTGHPHDSLRKCSRVARYARAVSDHFVQHWHRPKRSSTFTASCTLRKAQEKQPDDNEIFF
jgi:hypothetical protein